MFSITRSEEPRPELRVTLRSCTPGRPHEAQRVLDKVDRDDEEIAERAALDDCPGPPFADRGAADDELALVRLAVALALDDFAGEKDVFEIEDREVVIVKFFNSVNGHNVVQGTNTVADSDGGRLRHSSIVATQHCDRPTQS